MADTPREFTPADAFGLLRSYSRHRDFVRLALLHVTQALERRGVEHDASKMLDDEFAGFARINAAARVQKFGSPEYAEANGLTTIGDLAGIPGVTLGANTEFETRWREGLGETYGFGDFAFKAIDDYGGPGTLADLLAGNIQVADIYTTTPSIVENDLVVLEDDQDLFAAQNIVPLLNADILTDDLAALLDEVSALITTDVLLDLNAQFAGDDKPSAADVATEWLTAQGLI